MRGLAGLVLAGALGVVGSLPCGLGAAPNPPPHETDAHESHRGLHRGEPGMRNAGEPRMSLVATCPCGCDEGSPASTPQRLGAGLRSGAAKLSPRRAEARVELAAAQGVEADPRGVDHVPRPVRTA